MRVGLADRVYISGTAEASDGTYAQYVLCGELQAALRPLTEQPASAGCRCLRKLCMYHMASPLGKRIAPSTDVVSVRARVLSSATVPSERGTTLTEHAAVQLAPPDARVCVGDVRVRPCVCVRACEQKRARTLVCVRREDV